VIVVGSQSILGSFDYAVLPAAAKATMEVDLIPDVTDSDLLMFLSDAITGAAGELSLFDQTHGFCIDGVDMSTSTLPTGWRDRLVAVSNPDTIDPLTGVQYTGWCLDPADCCVAKLCAGRQKDIEFVFALFNEGLVDPGLVAQRLLEVPDEPASKKAQADAAVANFFSGPTEWRTST